MYTYIYIYIYIRIIYIYIYVFYIYIYIHIHIEALLERHGLAAEPSKDARACIIIIMIIIITILISILFVLSLFALLSYGPMEVQNDVHVYVCMWMWVCDTGMLL